MLVSMARKRAKSHSGKVTARLPDALKGDYRAWIQKHGDSHKYFGRRIGIEQCTAALVDFFMRGLDDRQRHMLLENWLPDVEAQEMEDWDRAMELADYILSGPAMEELLPKLAKKPEVAGVDTGEPTSVQPVSSAKDASGVDDIPMVPGPRASGKSAKPKQNRKRPKGLD